MVRTVSALPRVILSLIALVAFVGATLLANVSNSAIAGSNPPPPPGRVVVKVTDPDGKPVAGAIVELLYKDRAMRREMTGADGMAGFRSVLPARYGVRAGKRGVGVAHDAINVEKGKTTGVRLTLKKPSTTGSGGGNSVTSGDSSSAVMVK